MYQQYVNLGISVIPLLPKSKQPHFSKLVETGWFVVDAGKKKALWQPAQEHIAPPETLKTWFSTDNMGIALVGGLVSGRLVYLDFDTAEAYKDWAIANKGVVKATAIQKTARGYHVFIRLAEGVDLHGGKMEWKGEKVGEIKGEGGYVACYPSIHPTGVQYTWLRHPHQGIVTLSSLEDVGLKQRVETPPAYEPRPANLSNRSVSWAQKQLHRLNSCRANDYQTWLAVGMALSQLGTDGLSLWHDWSARSNKYDPRVLDSKWKSFEPGKGLTLNSLSFWANEDDPQPVRGAPIVGRWQTI